jgi:hypothetical protein
MDPAAPTTECAAAHHDHDGPVNTMRQCFLFVVALVLFGACRSAPELTFIQRLSTFAPAAKWDAESLHADFDCDGQLDVAQLGHRTGEVVVGIVPARDREPRVLTFAVGAGQQQAICAEPARLAWESLADGPPEDIGPIPGYPTSTSCKGLELSGGECDFVHVFWNLDTRRFDWWRR